ncbi:heavy metal translocating P-type ATPase [Candidatus Synechococcus calcipolaris G9]|uniref:Heavy metal translocating P-type ATPase n=1 Tax=Candidatus Synechococcus calcipolaris G9 TaxID=1497997 RepID=A0ABT6EXU9_9SYNE|nr:heavy metal translocating P-type ATPase [Candidatus Synechococcus calcipolaris]MDG2990624.1 heavy metal translocating P-type ATPase [Candidatus Synechococcus calcipolaris G9]
MTVLTRSNPVAQEAVSVVSPEDVHYQVVHWITGRFRIRIPRLGYDAEYAAKLLYVVSKITAVTTTRINPPARSLVVEYNPKLFGNTLAVVQAEIFQSIQSAATLPEVPLLEAEKDESSEDGANEHSISLWERLGMPAVGLGLSLGALMGVPIPGYVLASVVIAGALPVFKRAWDSIVEERQLTIDFLDGLAIALHAGHGNYFAPAFMLGLIEGGEVIRDMTARGSERASLDLLDCLGKTAFIERDGIEVEVPVKDIVEGDRVVLYPGDQVPVDGIVLRGTGLVDQCKLTGESVPVERSEGMEVFASTLLVDGQLVILTERVGNNTRAGVIVGLMQAAPVHDTRIENYAGTVANQMVVPTLGIAAGVGLMSGDIGRAIALLTLDLGTGIRVSVPTTILSALTYAAQHGVLIRSGRAIEYLARLDTIVFDKTGTLTKGHAGLTDIKVMDERFTADEILSMAASAEQGLTHPVAEAIVRHARELNMPLHDCEDWEYRVGLGVATKVCGVDLRVGSRRLMDTENICLEDLNQRFPDLNSGSCSVVYIGGDGRLIGVLLYSDPIRDESRDVISELTGAGITPHMLTGDVGRVARAVAKDLGIAPKNIYAEAFPERKVEVVKSLHDSGKVVAFCGDGINDSAALAYADVSISFAGATDIARETADVVLMEDDLRGLTLAIRIAKQAMEIVWQNTAIVALPNVGALLSGIFFALDPILAVVINNGTAILAELNGLRPLVGPGGPLPLPPVKDTQDFLADWESTHPSNPVQHVPPTHGEHEWERESGAIAPAGEPFHPVGASQS